MEGHFFRRYEGNWWCENEDVISEECTDYDRCNNECVCNIPVEVQDCLEIGAHLTSCDEDGYCNFCGYQDSLEEV